MPSNAETPARRVSYLVNQYPLTSHSFIRREILALEAQGIVVDRFALRGWDAPLVDPGDLADRERTRYVQRDGLPALLGDALNVAIRSPMVFLRALGTALAMSRRAVRPWPYHLAYLLQACRVKRWCADTGAAHLHAHFGTNPAEIALLVKLLGGPEYSFTIHGRGEADGGARLHFDRKVGGATFVAAVSGYTRSQLMREIDPALWDKVKVVHCGLDDSFFPDTAPPLPAAPTFLAVGRLSPEKGHLILLDAFAHVRNTHSDARLVIVGDGDMRPATEAKIAALGLSDSVALRGWRSAAEVRDELTEATALVQPSFIEGLPVVIMEAMAMYRPVISTYVAGIPELVLPGETGWLVPAGDIDSLAAAMQEAANAPPEQLSAIGAAGHARAKERHSVTTESAKLARLIFGDGDPT